MERPKLNPNIEYLTKREYARLEVRKAFAKVFTYATIPLLFTSLVEDFYSETKGVFMRHKLGLNLVVTVLGVAGIGDLVTTCNSPMSRNFTVGFRLAKGETLENILADMEEIAEGVNTVRIAKKCADFYKIRALITDRLYKVLFEGMTVEEALEFLMRFPLSADIDFI